MSRLLSVLSLPTRFLFFGLLTGVLLTACAAQVESTQPEISPEPTEEFAASGSVVTDKPTQTHKPNVTVDITAGTVSFSAEVLPILQTRCSACHGSTPGSGGFSITSYDSILNGSNNGVVVIAGNPSASLLIQLVTSGFMPKSGSKLTSNEIQLISDWISQGALNN